MLNLNVADQSRDLAVFILSEDNSAAAKHFVIWTLLALSYLLIRYFYLFMAKSYQETLN